MVDVQDISVCSCGWLNLKFHGPFGRTSAPLCRETPRVIVALANRFESKDFMSSHSYCAPHLSFARVEGSGLGDTSGAARQGPAARRTDCQPSRGPFRRGGLPIAATLPLRKASSASRTRSERRIRRLRASRLSSLSNGSWSRTEICAYMRQSPSFNEPTSCIPAISAFHPTINSSCYAR